MQSGLWNPLITLARLSRSCIRRLRMIQWESLTRTASAPASYAPPIAALASPVMYRRQVWYSEPFGRTSSGSVTPETPSISTETKTFTRFLLYHQIPPHLGWTVSLPLRGRAGWGLLVDARTFSRYKYYSR